jgi:hypothetical protein
MKILFIIPLLIIKAHAFSVITPAESLYNLNTIPDSIFSYIKNNAPAIIDSYEIVDVVCHKSAIYKEGFGSIILKYSKSNSIIRNIAIRFTYSQGKLCFDKLYSRQIYLINIPKNIIIHKYGFGCSNDLFCLDDGIIVHIFTSLSDELSKLDNNTADLLVGNLINIQMIDESKFVIEIRINKSPFKNEPPINTLKYRIYYKDKMWFASLEDKSFILWR